MKEYDLKSVVLRIMPEALLYDPEKCWMPLFHGTSQNVLDLSEEERKSRIAASKILIDYCYPILCNYGLGKLVSSKFPEVFKDSPWLVQDAFSCALSMKSGCSWYEYDSVYATFDPGRALNYARRSYICGELGYVAYYLYQGVKQISVLVPPMTDEEEAALSIILNAAEKEPLPVVFFYLGVEKTRIQEEGGKPINWEHRLSAFMRNYHQESVRITGDFDITSGKIINVDDIPEVK